MLSTAGCGKDHSPAYREKPLLSVEWGAKAGKFGLAIPAEGETVGPRTFTVDDDGRIHIFDAIKRNIKVFDREGVFQGSVGKELPGYSFAVHKGDYYFLDGETIHRYTLSGTRLESYPIARALTLNEGYAQWMRIDQNGELYVKSQGKSYRICEGIGTRNTVLPEAAQVQSERRGTPDRSGARWFVLAKERANRFLLRIRDRQGNLLKEFPVETTESFGSVIFLDRDDKGIIYLENQRIGADGVVRLEIRRYRDDGRLLESWELPNRYHTIVYKKVLVDRKGVLYQMQTTPSGVRIVKWDKE